MIGSDDYRNALHIARLDGLQWRFWHQAPADICRKHAQTFRRGEQGGSRLGAQAGDDVAPTFAVSELTETQRQKVIILGESAWGARVGKPFNTTGKLRRIQSGGDLRKNGGWCLHERTMPEDATGLEPR